MKLGQLEKKLFLIFFPILNFFYLLPQFLSKVCPDQIHFSHSFYKKYLQSHQKKALDECSSTLKSFLLIYVHISILVS